MLSPCTEKEPSGWAEAFTAEEIRNAQTYDHVDEITRTGLIHNHNVAINAGSEKFRLYASFNYYDQNSILKVSDMKRFSGRLNFVMWNQTAGLGVSGEMEVVVFPFSSYSGMFDGK